MDKDAMKYSNFSLKKYLVEESTKVIDIFNRDGLNILKAPTGSGKTIATLLCAVSYVDSHKDYIVVLLTPNRSQSEQNSNKRIGSIGIENDINNLRITNTNEIGCYTKFDDVIGIVGGVDINDIDLKHTKIVSCVYDRAKELINYLAAENKKIICIIDEAHEIYKSYNYRGNAINSMLEATKNKNIKNLIYMTATTDVLTINRDTKFNNFTNFTIKNRAKNTDKLKIYRYEKNYQETLLKYIIDNLEEAKNKEEKLKIILRFNSKNDALLFKDSVLTKYNVICITSESKNECDEYKSIVENETFGECDVLITTSLMDSGVSIQNKYNTIWIFVSTHRELDIDNIKQSFNRCRNKYKEAVLFIKNSVRYNSIAIKQREKNTLEALTQIISAFKKLGDSNGSIRVKINTLLELDKDTEMAQMVTYVDIDENLNLSINNIKKSNYLMHIEACKCVNFKGKLVKELDYLAEEIEEIFLPDSENKINSVALKKQTKVDLKEVKKEQTLFKNETRDIALNIINESFIDNIIIHFKELSKYKLKDTVNNFIIIFSNSDNLENYRKKDFYNAFADFYKQIKDKEKNLNDDIDVTKYIELYVDYIKEIINYLPDIIVGLEDVTIAVQRSNLKGFTSFKTKIKPIRENELVSDIIKGYNKSFEDEIKYKEDIKKYINDMMKYYGDINERAGVKIVKYDKESIKKEAISKIKLTTSIDDFLKLAQSNHKLCQLIGLRTLFDAKIQSKIYDTFLTNSLIQLNKLALKQLTKEDLLKLVKTYYKTKTKTENKNKYLFISSLKTTIK
ncbi:MAG TPA: DEAD/DEAH box helicase family protein [Candidatus Paceibacterota bacterium]